MRAVIGWFIKYPIWSNVLLFGLFLFGYMGLKGMRSSFFPEAEPSLIQVVIAWPGASAEEVEEGAVQRIEENLRGIEGVSLITSVSRENSANVTVEIADGADISKVTEDVKSAVDQVSPWPSGAELPIVKQSAFRMRALSIAISGEGDPWAIKSVAQNYRDALYQTQEISQVSLSGFPDREIVIEVRQQDLLRYKINFANIVSAVQTQNLDLSGGTIRTQGEEILIRSYAKESTEERIRRIPVLQSTSGAQIYLEQIANIREQWNESPERIVVNGKSVVVVSIEQTSTENILTVAKEAKRVLEEFQARYPHMKFQVLEDPTILLQGRIDILVTNGIQGFFLVLIALTMFLNWRLSFWVAMGIPTAFAGMFVVISLWGITINVISLMGMIIVLGMLVDDAIVTAENIFQKFEAGAKAGAAAIEGAAQIAAPIFSSVMTTIFAFLPFFFFAGALGNTIWQVSLVVIAALAFSFIESMVILPPHLAHSKALVAHDNPPWLRRKLNQGQAWLSQVLYGKSLRWALHHWPVALVIPLVVALLTAGAMKGGVIGMSEFSTIDRDDVKINLEMIPGTSVDQTLAVLTTIEDILWQLNKELKAKRKDGKDVVLTIARYTTADSHIGKLEVNLLSGEERNLKTTELQKMVRKRMPSIAGISKFSFGGSHWGKPISVSLVSKDIKSLEKANMRIQEKMREIPAIKDVVDNDLAGLREIRLEVNKAGKALGMTTQGLASQVRQAFFGQEVQKLQRGEDEIRVWARLTSAERSHISDLENLQVLTPAGNRVFLKDVASYTMERGRVGINHLDGQRELRIEADLADAEAAPGPIRAEVDQIVKSVLHDYPAVSLAISGQVRQNKLFSDSVGRSFPPALVAIFILLVLMHRSVPQAMLIVGMIPLGVMGALWGHVVHDQMVSRMSMFGLVALTGVVINNSIVMIETYNELLRKGHSLLDAVYLGSVSRFRPMLLTTLTTVLGLAPLIFEKSLQAQFLIPLAITLAYGLIGGTLFILFVTPTAFLFINRLRMGWKWLQVHFAKAWNGGNSAMPLITPESVEPAVIELQHETQEEWT